MSDLSKRITALPAKKYELLLRRLNRERAESALPQLVPQPRDANGFPLSFAQQRLWFLNQLAPDSAAYHIPIGLRLSGPLDLAALQLSLDTVVRRHEILRTTFTMIDGRTVQMIGSVARMRLTVVSLQALAEQGREAQIAQLAITETQAPFDLSRGPLVRTSLLRLRTEEHVLLLTMHHIISDQWSMAIFLQEVTTLYRAERVGREALLPDLPIQYADFACWQRQWLQGAVLDSQLDYWRERLADPPDPLLLPTDRPRPPIQTFRGAVRSLGLPASIAEALNALSQREGTTLFMTLLAAFEILLARYTGQEDLVIGSPIAGRTRAETERLIGFFVNTLVLRIRLSGNPSFRELLRRVYEVALAAYAHQDIPFEQLVEVLKPERNLSYTPLFQVAFALQNAPSQPPELGTLTLQPLTSQITTAKFDLTLELAENSQGLTARLEYNTDLFDDASMARMLNHYQRVLERVLADPDRRLANVRLLSAAEEWQLLVEWNATQATYPAEACISALVEQQAAHTPDAIVLVDGSRHLSYGALTHRAGQLARYLQNRGVGPEICVALCLPRSLDLVIGMLGVLIAGGAYVPLAPASPPDRLAFMCGDARAPLLLTRSTLYEQIGGVPASICSLDTDWPQIAASASSPLRSGSVDPANLAYVIYTSGSTGMPKGVAISHNSLVNLVAWHQRTYQISASDRATQVAGVGFDAAGWELWPYLAIGASVDLPDAATLATPESLQRWLIEHVITISFLPTPLAELVLPLAWPRRPTLRHMLTGGDQLHRYPAASLPFTLLNHYGPTEVTVVTSVAAVESGDAHLGSPPIGRPIANIQIYLLDRDLQPAPVGILGEMYIGGVGLARGYLDRPDLTAERFVPNPFSQESGVRSQESEDEVRFPEGARKDERQRRYVGVAPLQNPKSKIQNAMRLYKTGDLARYRPDGAIEFLGRIDHQVKLRGLRIELGEIESVMMQQAGVRAAAVLVQGMGPEDKRLIAYVAMEPEATPSVTELRAGLKSRLPHYMAPATFVLLDSLPLTPNGKIDRRALLALSPAQPSSDPALAAPRSPVEDLLAQLWAAVLHVERVGIHDNFFALGGHSLLATQLLAQIRQTLQVELPLRALFDAPTVAGLAAYLAQAQDAALTSPPLVPQTRGIPSPLSFAQERLWFFDQLDPGSAVYNISTAMILIGSLDIGALEASLDSVVRRHESLRTTFTVVHGQPRQRASATSCRLPIADLQGLPAAERERQAQRLAAVEALRSFDLTNGPLLYVLLIRVDHLTHVLIATMHHIISDGWSMSILARELSTFYSAQRTGRPAPLPDLPIQYADYATWQRHWLQGEVLERHLGYWRRQLADLPRLELTADHPYPASTTFQGARKLFYIAPTLHAALKALNRASRTTLFMTLLAAFQTLLSRYTGQNDIVVGSPIANRTRAELEPLIGFFVNTLVLRTDLSGSPTFRTLLQRVRMMTLDAYAHQDLPFEKLVEELQPVRELGSSPLFQVMFVLQNASVDSLDLLDLTAHPLALAGTLAKFDLTLDLVETAQGLSVSMEYKTALFDAPTISRMQHHFQVLLAACATAPDTSITHLPLLMAAEQHQFLVEWNSTTADYPRDTVVHRLIEEQVERTPDAVAVLYEDQQITYCELNARANQLAHTLRAYGIDADRLVALSMERGLEMIIAILAIHKAGGAYVPLDPTYPAERLAFMLTDSQASVLITATDDRPPPADQRKMEDKGSISSFITHHSSLSSAYRLVALSHCAVVDLRAGWPAIAAQPRTNGRRTASPQHLAYVIYTSGSTGSPKGVMITQRGLLNLCYGLRAFFTDSAIQHTGLITSISFDISVNQIFPTLLFGRTLQIIPDRVKYDSVALLPYIAAQRIDLLDSVPSYFQMVLQAHAPARLRTTLRYLLIGGEKVEPQLLDSIFDQLGPQVALVNIYGLTEISDINAFAVHTAAHGIASITVGRPLQNNQIYILDRYHQPLPIGLAGEICIAGESLARGYHNRPDLTAERFIPNPFAMSEGKGRTAYLERSEETKDKSADSSFRALSGRRNLSNRLCKTGDLGRWRADGAIEILGRLDQQIKIRGYRIEVGEIEAALTQHPAVRKAAVLARAEGTSDRRLVAYVVPANDEPAFSSSAVRPSSVIGELRTFLEKRLPGYMIPSAFVALADLPTTPSGKLDRKALPAPDIQFDQASYVAARTVSEELLAGIWAELLQRDRISVQDNFFALGGHSLLATQAVARVRSVFGVELPLRALFEHPTIAELAAQLDALRIDARSALPSLASLPRGDSPPLSFAQERLWFLDQFAPGSVTYTIPAAVRVQGALRLPALAQSFGALIQRHEILRTTFATVDGAPFQVIAAQARLPLCVADLSALPADRRDRLARRLATTEAQQPFDLARGPLLRSVLLRHAPDDHTLLLTMHHIISDAWSIGVLIRELAQHYAAYTTGQGVALAPLPVQYADYALWQRQWFQGAVRETQLAYWRAQLAEAPPVLELPADRPRPARQSFRGGQAQFSLSAALRDGLHALARQNNATLFMTLLAAFQVLLARYSGQQDIVVGSPIANRTQQAAEGVIGCFVNTLALRTDLSGAPSFRALLGRVREVCLQAYAHQDLPFEQLVEDLHPARDLSHTPLFQVLFVLQNAPQRRVALPDATLQPQARATATAKFDLTLALSEDAEELAGAWEYAADLFDVATIARMTGQFQTLLAGTLAAPDRRIADLPLLTARERQQLLVEWNASQQVALPHHSLAQLFEAQAARRPDAVAVTYEGRQLSYHALNARANQLAHALRAMGVGPDTLVALSVERSLDLVIGILGILKAGGAYAPIDPSYPAQRRAYLLADTQATAIVTQARLVADLPPHHPQALCLDADPRITRQPRANLAHTGGPQRLAYVIYTSGSTGSPKGVLISHANVLRLFAATDAWFQFDAEQVWTLFHAYAFDFSVWELWGALLYGGRLAVAPYWVSRAPDAFYALLSRERVTALNQTPSAFGQLVQAQARLTPAPPLALRWVIFGGEALALEQLKPWFARHGDRIPQLVNMYGITETTVHVTYRPVCAADLHAGSGSMIGARIPDLQLYVLDRQLQPAPLGVAGELYVGGSGLARGYHGRPDLTAERFVPNPFASVGSLQDAAGSAPTRDDRRLPTADCRLPAADCRLYKTGDRARYLANGDLEYLGRLDQQVKIRGFRIELGEIEAALRQHPAIQEAVVLVQHDEAPPRLVAYLVVRPPAPTLADLRRFLQATLPEYMLPAAFVLRDRLPLTANGKLDLRALAASRAQTNLSDGAAYVAPRTEIETLLVNAWQQVLGVTPIGIHDNYFALGGDSIRVIQLLHAIKQHQLSATVPDLFQHQTIDLLAQHLAKEQQNAEHALPMELVRIPAQICEILPADRDDAYPAARMQELMLFQYANNQQQTGIYHVQQSFYIQSAGFSLATLKSALELLVQKHVILRTVFFTEQLRRPIQIVKKTLAFSIAVADIRNRDMPAQERYIQAAMQHDRRDLFDTSDLDAPLFRFKVFLRSDETFEFLMSIHHAIDDGWGNIEFLKELVEVYLALQRGEAAAIAPLANTYKEFVALEQALIASDAALQFWNNHLGTYQHQPLPQRASWRQDPADGHQIHVFASELISGLQQLSRRLGCSLKAIFLSAYFELLRGVSGAEVATAGVVVNGRSARLTDPLKALGLFWNIIPVRYQITAGERYAQIRNVQHLLIEVEAYASYPLLELLERRAEAELFFATFNFLHFYNLRTIAQAPDVQILRSRGHDRFHYPLNTTLSVNPFDSQVTMRIEYDRRYFSADAITALVHTYTELLKCLLQTEVALQSIASPPQITSSS